jgi:hypothetical protein
MHVKKAFAAKNKKITEVSLVDNTFTGNIASHSGGAMTIVLSSSL